jgi:hypothetical protein
MTSFDNYHKILDDDQIFVPTKSKINYLMNCLICLFFPIIIQVKNYKKRQIYKVLSLINDCYFDHSPHSSSISIYENTKQIKTNKINRYFGYQTILNNVCKQINDDKEHIANTLKMANTYNKLCPYGVTLNVNQIIKLYKNGFINNELKQKKIKNIYTNNVKTQVKIKKLMKQCINECLKNNHANYLHYMNQIDTMMNNAIDSNDKKCDDIIQNILVHH